LTGDSGRHVVYSIHDFPSSINNSSPDSGTPAVQFRNTAWGYLVTNNVAPVWIGAAGASLDGTNSNLTDEQGWANMLQAYANGQDGSLGGPAFSGCQQPVGVDWWTFGNLNGQSPDGTLNNDGTNRSAQQSIWSTFLYTTCTSNGGVGGTTWNANDKSANITLSTDLLTASDGAAGRDGVRSNTSQSGGKQYWEIKATTESADWAAGLSNASFANTLGAGLGGDGNGIGFYNTSPAQAIYYNAVALSTGSMAGATGDVIYFAADIPNHLLWVSSPVMRASSVPWNNSGSANPATGVGGLSFSGLTCPCFITFNTQETPSQATINGGGPFVGTVPTGFTAWQQPVSAPSGHPILINWGY
jgi:hypothetical protein